MSRETKPTEVRPEILEYRRQMAENGHPAQPDTYEAERKAAERKAAIEKAKQENIKRAGRRSFL